MNSVTARLRRAAAPIVFLTSLTLLPGALHAQRRVGPHPQHGIRRHLQRHILRATLPNGLHVVLVRDPLAPVATMVMNYKVGSDEVPGAFPGTAHAEEHMMFRGSRGLSADQLAELTADMGGDFDADTQNSVTQYFFTVPADDVDVALHVASIRMRSALNTQADWAKERGAIEQEVSNDLSNPFFVLYTKMLKTMFAGTPYAWTPLGTRPSFEQTNAAMLAKFHDDWYVPNNAILVVAGDIDLQHTLATVKTLFIPIPAKPLPARPKFHFGVFKAQRMDTTTDFPVGITAVTFRMPGARSPDYAAAQVLSDVLNSQRGSLYALVPQGKALEAGFDYNTSLPRAGLGMLIGVFPRGGPGEQLIQQEKAIIAADLKNGLPAGLVEAAKRQELTAAEQRRNSISGLAFTWSTALAIEGKQSPEEDIQAIERVTPSDVNRVARKYLNFDHAITSLLTPQTSGKPISNKSFGGQESFAPSSVKPVPLPAWAQQAVGRLVLPKMTVHPTVSRLSNGLKLIVVPESVSNTVTVVGRMRYNTDLEQPKGQEGEGQVLDQLFSYGTTSLDRLAFLKALDDIGASEGAGPDFNLTVLKPHFDRGLQLLAANELHPALPAQAFKIIQMQTARSVAGTLKSPGFLSQMALLGALYPHTDPSLRHATPQSVMSLNLQQIKDFYQKAYRPDLTTIVVIGNIDPAYARSEVEKYFGAWKTSGPKPVTDYPLEPNNAASVATVPDRSRKQDKVVLAEVLRMNRFNPDYYALELGNNVLGGGFYATRFYRDLREKAGLVYFVGGSLNVGRTRGVYSVSFGCDPGNVSKARQIILRDLHDMQTANVSPQEMLQARTQLLRSIPLSEQSEGSIAGGLLSRSITGLPLDEPVIAGRYYLALTAQQVEAAYAKWLKLSRFVQVTTGPAPQ